MGFYLNKRVKMKVSFLLVIFITTQFTKTLCQKEDKIQIAFECDDFRKAKEQFESNYLTYTFKITTNRGTFDNCRQQCIDLGGDLIQHNLELCHFVLFPALRRLFSTVSRDAI